MDKIQAEGLEKRIKGITLSGYEVIELINYGKSAAVFKAKRENKLFALKIFDDELIERFGYKIQTKRIQQEVSLKNHTIRNLVRIYEGGNTTVGDQPYFFIVMELINGINLKDYINLKKYGQEFILKVLETLIATADALLVEKEIAHRDIKPENIMVDEKNNNIILMDLGVLKLVGAKSFTDEEERSFVGTLRYAPPEFLLRTEEDSIKGWRAINIYQIGATLHDLIMRCELFYDKTPYPNLVIAIKEDTPKILNPDISFELQQLTRDMMIKDWRKRLELISDKRLHSIYAIKEKPDNSFEEGVEEILKMRMSHQAKFDEIEKLRRTKDEIRKRQKEFASILSNEMDRCFETIRNKGIFNSFKKSKRFVFSSDGTAKDSIIQNYLYELIGELKMGFPRNLYILVRMSNNEDNYTEIELFGIFPSIFSKATVDDPLNLFDQIIKEKQRNPHNAYYELKTIKIFQGVVNFDESFIIHLSTQIISLISKALKLVEKDVQNELEWLEKLTKSNQSINSRETTRHHNIIIDSL